ncbi:hypothetical protein BDE02_19G095300 [Populus trichocarpa]|nr:hypothetical protein BDE02_19G095300 [Populus trichocarpa]
MFFYCHLNLKYILLHHDIYIIQINKFIHVNYTAS